ncbi:hypothetical protein A0H81_09235 [Grifola frondosa]|uniref:Yippee domain-containing protein n=1 Tax=Grifola frondosa TaxID=5627 RepID=A0A1C7M1D6_GRIFR|nr:hypothetical protein A0H81_09235 [Grifola frondosa]
MATMTPTSDTKSKVISTFHDHPTFSCAQCASVICTDRGLYRTGVHTVADVYCMGCNERLGWYYHKASDTSQKYKEGLWVDTSLHSSHRLPTGKYLLEREKLVKENAWKLD